MEELIFHSWKTSMSGSRILLLELSNTVSCLLCSAIKTKNRVLLFVDLLQFTFFLHHALREEIKLLFYSMNMLERIFMIMESTLKASFHSGFIYNLKIFFFTFLGHLQMIVIKNVMLDLRILPCYFFNIIRHQNSR